MKLLADENLSIRVARRLADVGYDVVHVTEVGLGNTDDPVIFDWAADEDRAVVTSDADFGGLLAVGGASGGHGSRGGGGGQPEPRARPDPPVPIRGDQARLRPNDEVEELAS